MFKLRVDTGGTFTDCWALAPGETKPRLAKVLSSGRLRVSVAKWLSDREAVLDLPGSWRTKDGFFTGYRVEAGRAKALVLSYNDGEKKIVLSHPVDLVGSVDLFTGEEAPVLGARLLTGTSRDEEFPPLEFRLATTRGTNALLERKGARTVLFVTSGFADLLVIRDQRRPDLFALNHIRPAPLAERVVEVTGRLDAEGKEIAPLVLDEAFEQAARAALADGIETAAVALLHSYRNPAHEIAVRDRLVALGFPHVSVSSGLAPLIKILPRTETAVANAYLHPAMQGFLDDIRSRIGEENRLLTMTSAGGLEPVETYCPKDSLLSGPAGGISGAAAVAEDLGFDRILTFDMGGTSTDVARYDRGFRYRFEQVVGDARLLSPALQIETVASGGGSICRWAEGGLRVGPESAGADPGPACYGRGGPLTITDVNLLLGRIDPENFGIPLGEENLAAARAAVVALQREAGIPGDDPDPDFLAGLLEIATEQMADAIRTISVRDGADPADYALLAFGGAGPLHACDIAERLGCSTILVPAEAGLLSAYGLERASVERFSETQVNLASADPALPDRFAETDETAAAALAETGFEGGIVRRLAEVRLAGQDATLSIEVIPGEDLAACFRTEYRTVFGYDPPADRAIEIASYRAIAGTGRSRRGDLPVAGSQEPTTTGDRKVAPPCDSTGSGRALNPVGSLLDRAELRAGDVLEGPIVIQDPFSTLYLKSGWTAEVAENGALVVRRDGSSEAVEKARPEQIERELFRHRFDQIVVEMGTMLQRSAVSTNVKERADFSCALLDADGNLVTSAPHIPVHLGALGLCVRMVRERIEMRPGDTIVTNHPAAGGSHLPDVTLVTPVFAEGGDQPVAYLANRAHHAEIGGKSPGSMPPDATSLAEEGVVIAPTRLVAADEARFAEIEAILTTGPFPTRNLRDNLADLNAQLAANQRGQKLLETMLDGHGAHVVAEQMTALKTLSADTLGEHLAASGFRSGEATEHLDDGTEIRVRIENQEGKLKIDFTGTSASHPGNLNATAAILRSAVLYVLRLWTQRPVPLNEGLLAEVEIELPTCFLNPDFDVDPTKCPAVVGGNVETSQRVVDALIRALGIQACSQGTMNNLLFGDETFGYYETICGGAGAGPGYDGASGIHTHMTNTAITDPEILEQRYPVRLHRFALRRGSGGEGRWRGGDGIVREIEFLRPLRLSLLTQHRVEEPYGMDGGGPGTRGRQTLDGEQLPGLASCDIAAGARLVMETPGGGGCGGEATER